MADVDYTIKMQFRHWNSTATRSLNHSKKHATARKWFDNCVAICGKDEQGVSAITAALYLVGNPAPIEVRCQSI